MYLKKIFLLSILFLTNHYINSINPNYITKVAPAIGKTILRKSALTAWYAYVGAVIIIAADSTVETIYPGLSPENKQKIDQAYRVFKKNSSN